MVKPTGGIVSGSVSLQASTSLDSTSLYFVVTPDPKTGGSAINVGGSMDGIATAWKASWVTDGLPTGDYFIKAVGQASGGGEAFSSDIKVTLSSGGGGATVTLVKPMAGETLSGSASLSATTSWAADSLMFVVTPSGGSPTSIPGVPDGTNTSWSATWDTTKFSNGAYSVLARGYAGSTPKDSATASLTVYNAPPFTVIVNAPTAGVSWSGTKEFSATASSPAVTMKFFVKAGSTTVATVDGTSSDGLTWTANWDTTSVPNGAYSFLATAKNSSAQVASKGVDTFGVSNAAPLTVSVSSPVASETLSGTKGLAATSSATAVSMSFVIKNYPSLTVAATVSGTSGDGKSWTANWDTTSLPNGAYVLDAKATTAGMATATYTVMGLTVSNAAPLTVSVGSPLASETLSGTENFAATTSVTATALAFVLKSYPGLATVATANATSGDGKSWTANVDTTKIANGSYVLEAKATAPGPVYATATVSGLAIANAAPLTVSVGSPSSGVTLDTTASFVATTSVSVSSLSFAVRASTATLDSAPLATATATSGDGKSWTATWDTKGVANGDYKVTAVAVKDGLPTASAAVGFKILNALEQQQQNVEAVTVSITSPEQSASVTGKITLSATANQAVDSAQFLVTGPSGTVALNAIGNGTKTVWTLLLDTASAPNGDYSAVAKVAKGGVSTSSAARAFKVANVSVSIGFTAPANGATLSGVTDVVIAAVPQASSVAVRVTSVADTTKFSERAAKYDGALQVWKLPWNTADFPNQKYRLDASATDAQGQKYYASPLTVTVSNDAPPAVQEFSVKTTSPRDGGIIYGNVPLAAVVTGEAVAVKFYVTPEAGGTIVSVDGHFDPDRKAWVGTWPSLGNPNGSYKFGTVAFNAKNAKAEGIAVTATLSNKAQVGDEPAAQALSVKLTSPADGSATDRVRLVAVTEGAPTAVSFVVRRKGVTEPILVIPAHFDSTAKAWTADWDTTKAEVGTYALTAIAKDAVGGQAESNVVSLYLERQTVVEPPKDEGVLPTSELAVRIVRPADGATVRGPVVVAAKTDASATRVAFFGRDGRGTQVFALAGVFSRDFGAWVAYLDTKSLSDGKYELSAAATDAAGKRVLAATGFVVANASTDAVEKVDVIPVEAVRDAAKAPPEGTKPLVTERIAPPPPDVAEKLYKECADADIVPARCEAWLASRRPRNECRDAGIVTKEECVAFLKRAHGAVPGCDGKDENACAEAVVKETAGLASADELDRAAKAIDKHVGSRVVIPPSGDDAEKEKPSPDDVRAYVSVSRRDGLNLEVHASPSFVRTDDETSHRSIPAVLFIDTDGDGLPDDAEKRIGTKPDVADSDGDGFSDGDEVKNGYNPLGRGRLTDGVVLSPVDVAIISGAPIEHPKSAGKETDELTVVDAKQEDKEEVVRLSGKARPREVVTLFVYSYLPVVLTTQADENGDWSYDLGATLDDGEHEVYVAVTDETGKIKEKGSPLSFFVAGAQAATADEFYKNEPAESSPTVAAIAAEPVRQSMLPYAIATGILLVLAGVIAFLLFRPKRGDGTPS